MIFGERYTANSSYVNMKRAMSAMWQPPHRSFSHGGWWLTSHPYLWNCVDDFGNCVPINNFTLVRWINDSHHLH